MDEILLNPNIAYLILVSGVLLAIMAILTPGTGVFEVGALFALLLAGWQTYNLPINVWALIVLLVGVFPFLLAVRYSRNLWFLGLAILALVIGSTFLFQGEGLLPAVNPILAIVVSILAGGFTWLLMTKTLAAFLTTPAHDLGSLIGAIGLAKTDIHEEGTIFVEMEDWSATSEAPINVGEKVRVIAREGLILTVEELPSEPKT